MQAARTPAKSNAVAASQILWVEIRGSYSLHIATPGYTTNLLNVVSQSARWSVMIDLIDIINIYTHTKCFCSQYNEKVTALEPIHYLLSLK